MPNLTPTIAKALDAARRVTLGGRATLAVLDHAPVGERGYVTVAPVKRGWSLQAGGIGEAATLKVCESRDVTKEVLARAVAFAVSGEVYKIDEGNVAAPIGDNLRVWIFKVKPSGEIHES
ncbi:MAG TPA: hypothetical protein VF762_02345 [Blastocatellia bacterium]|jgi:hypothetical protein